MTLTPNRFTGDDRSTDETPAYLVVGGENIGTTVTERLQANGHSVHLVTGSSDASAVAGTPDGRADVYLLEEAGIADGSTVVAATRSDRRNLLVAQLARARFDVPRTVALANSPCRLDVFEEAGHDPVCATSVLSDALLEEL